MKRKQQCFLRPPPRNLSRLNCGTDVWTPPGTNMYTIISLCDAPWVLACLAADASYTAGRRALSLMMTKVDQSGFFLQRAIQSLHLLVGKLKCGPPQCAIQACHGQLQCLYPSSQLPVFHAVLTSPYTTVGSFYGALNTPWRCQVRACWVWRGAPPKPERRSCKLRTLQWSPPSGPSCRRRSWCSLVGHTEQTQSWRSRRRNKEPTCAVHHVASWQTDTDRKQKADWW